MIFENFRKIENFVIWTQVVIFEKFENFQKMLDFWKISKVSEDKKFSSRRISKFLEDSEELECHLSNEPLPSLRLFLVKFLRPATRRLQKKTP